MLTCTFKGIARVTATKKPKARPIEPTDKHTKKRKPPTDRYVDLDSSDWEN